MEGETEKKVAAMAAQEVGKKKVAADGDVSLKELSKKLNDFAKERDWEQYHSPRNLLLAMVPVVSLILALVAFFLRSVTTIFAYED